MIEKVKLSTKKQIVVSREKTICEKFSTRRQIMFIKRNNRHESINEIIVCERFSTRKQTT